MDWIMRTRTPPKFLLHAVAMLCVAECLLAQQPDPLFVPPPPAAPAAAEHDRLALMRLPPVSAHDAPDASGGLALQIDGDDASRLGDGDGQPDLEQALPTQPELKAA